MTIVLLRIAEVLAVALLWAITYRRNQRWKADAALWETERDEWLAGVGA